MMKHLLNNRGESLAEVLVAVLIIAAGLLALAGMVRVASNSVVKSKNAVKTVYDAENVIENPQSKAESAKLKIDGGATTTEFDVNLYSDKDNKLYRYEVQKENNNANQNNE